MVRTEAGLAADLERLGRVRAALGDVDVRPSAEGWGNLAQALDLRAGVALADATLQAARARTETRGCHCRADHPGLDPVEVNLRTRLAAAGDGLSVEPPLPEPVPPVPPELVPWLERSWDAALAGRLLE